MPLVSQYVPTHRALRPRKQLDLLPNPTLLVHGIVWCMAYTVHSA